MADGTPFHMDKMYTVALNSYRGNGGGELLTKGAGISQDELKERIISSTDKDFALLPDAVHRAEESNRAACARPVEIHSGGVGCSRFQTRL